MDPDRKSHVSSFYGGRQPDDSLNNDFSGNPARPPRARYDSGSLHYNQEADRPRSSTEPLNGGTRSAGYNQNSFFDAGRTEPLKGGYDEEDPLRGMGDGSWDVFADFNNAGPRYSTAFVDPAPEPVYPSHSHGSLKHEDTASATGTHVEMVTVPALGPEWKASELHDMTRSAKKERKAEDRNQKWQDWRRGKRGMCGHWFSWKFTVYFVFGLCIATGILLAFLIPRVPKFEFNQDTPLSPASGDFNRSIPTRFLIAPANFSFPAFAELQVDTGSNFIPLKFTHLNALIFDLQTSVEVGVGDLYGVTVPAKRFTKIQVPMNFSYVANNNSDITWANWYNSCRNAALYPTGERPGLRFRLVLEMRIAGLIGSRFTSTQVTDANCPVELPMNAA